jgi:hypothetical protein
MFDFSTKLQGCSLTTRRMVRREEQGLLTHFLQDAYNSPQNAGASVTVEAEPPHG